MNKHELLRDICDEIGYYYIKEYAYIEWKWFYKSNEFLDKWAKLINLREIIFTQEFILLFQKKIDILLDVWIISFSQQHILYNWWYHLLYHLDNPVEYLDWLISTN